MATITITITITYGQDKAALEAKIAGRDATIRDLERKLTDRDRAVSDGKMALDAEIEKVGERNKDVAACKKTIAGKEKEVEDMVKQLAALQVTSRVQMGMKVGCMVASVESRRV